MDSHTFKVKLVYYQTKVYIMNLDTAHKTPQAFAYGGRHDDANAGV
jgi:hypothetical protein